MCGLIAATLAREGYQGAAEAIEGKWGFLHAYAPAADPAKAVDGLGRRWETMRIAVKPYPSCRYTHAAVDGILALAREHGIQAGEVEEVDVGLPEAGWKITGDPEPAKQSPKSVPCLGRLRASSRRSRYAGIVQEGAHPRRSEGAGRFSG
jgi:2-methylcitrate dehydratase PrpD